MKTSSEIRRINATAMAACFIAFALVITCALFVPLYDFSATVFTKKSGNTFVGDERYIEARAEVEAAAEARAAETGSMPEIVENVTERVNSKGEKTSMVAFEVRETMKKTGRDFAGSGLTSGVLLMIIVVLSCAAMFCNWIGMSKSNSVDWAEVIGWRKALRRLAGWLALIALLLVPVFLMQNNLAFSRQIKLAADGFSKPGLEALLQKLDRFLYGGTAGENTLSLMGGVSYRPTWVVWALLILLGIQALACVVAAEGHPAATLQRALLYAFIICLCALILYPYYVMVITGFRSNAETTDMYFQHLLPTSWVWSNIRDIINRGVPRYLLNSLMLSVGATGIALLCGIPAAYAMARMNFAGKKAFLGFVIMSQMFSPVVLLVGISRLMNALHLNDSVWGLMFINAAFNQAFAIWLLRGTFVSISSEMEQAAHIDGCNTVSAMLRVLLPMAAPGIVTTLIFVFINAWNEYTISTVLISTAANKPITVGITQFSSFNMIEWQYLFAAALVATVPVVILFMCIEKHLAAGLTAGGVKG